MARSTARVIVALGAFALPGSAAPAQVIPVRVAPIAEADQYGFFPSSNFGMANVSVALRDTLLDPWQNPALGARLGRGMYFGAPTFFAVSNGAGSGQAYPVGGITRLGRTFMGGALVHQAIDPARPRRTGFFPSFSSLLPLPTQPENETQSNRHVQGLVGHDFGGLTVAVSALWSDLRAVEGMELLFTDSRKLRQSGRRSDVRVGALKEWGVNSIEAVALRSRSRMSYDVLYQTLFWDPGSRSTLINVFSQATDDDITIEGVHLKYDRAVRDSTWRAGAVATLNRRFERNAAYPGFQGIPTDPSRTLAYNLGVGVSRDRAPLRFGFDVVLEPMWRRARTEPTFNTPDSFLSQPENTESYFKFMNVALRGGVSRDIVMSDRDTRLRLQLGTQLRNVNYRLEQHDFKRGLYRERGNSWREWTHAWGAAFLFPGFQFSYQLRLLSGMGRLGVPPEPDGDVVFADPFFGGPVAISNNTLYPVRVTSHQIFVTVPIR